jgi:glycosyltransferase involved in cell wall biosynthesis
MNFEPLISIIVPTYNRGHLIEKTLLSLLNQSDSRYEIIVVDDGSTDNTEDIIKSYLSDKVSYYKKENGERAASRNFGTQKARGLYINWFDSDDLALENHVAKAISSIEAHDNLDWFHLNYNIVNPFGELIKNGNKILNVNEGLKKGNIFSCNGVFVKKEIALKNPFNEDRALSASEDYELWLRLLSQYPCICINTITSSIVQHDERSVLMSDPQKLISRFEKFIHYTTSNEGIRNFLGNNYSYFVMKNYLILSVDLAAAGQCKSSKKFLKKSFLNSSSIVFERAFWASIYYIIKNTLL